MRPRSKHYSHHEIEELLSRAVPAEPPADLAARIKAEIPNPLTLAAAPEALEGPANVLRPAVWNRRWRPLLAAASLAATLGAGLFAYLNFSRVEPLAAPKVVSEGEAQGSAPPAQMEGAEADLVTSPPPAAARPAPSAKAAPPAPPTFAEVPAGEQGGIAGGMVQPVEVPESLPEPARQQRKDELVVTSESPLLDRRITSGSASRAKPEPIGVGDDEGPLRVGGEEEGVEGGVEGGVAGGVFGGVPGGVPGGTAAGVPSNERKIWVGTEAEIGFSTGGSAEPNDQAYGDVFFREYGVNPAIDTEDDRLSTFGLDVDTGSYTVMRRYLTDGNQPPREAIRVEELVNFFDYRDPAPRQGDFALYADAAPTPFAQGERYRLVRFGVKAREIDARDRKPALLVFTVDVSGSMDQENRLELVKTSLFLLLDELKSEDRVGLVVYGSRGRVLLEPTSDLAAIRRAVGELVAEGSTNAEEGLALAYELADRFFRPGAINRVILCSDGVANVGATGPESIGRRIETAAGKGIELTTVGFGMGNYNDVLMEQLADQGDGSYAYVDDLEEARRIFVENLTGTLQTVAADAKAQVEWNPEVVARWRLLGYENRDIADHKFRDDTVDAGEIGAGHAVTALYEVKLQPDVSRRAVAGTLFLRWRSKASGEVVEIKKELLASDFAVSWDESSRALRLASVAAELGEQLKGSYWAKDGSFAELSRRARDLADEMPGRADVAELVSLIGRAGKLVSGARPESE